MVLAGKRVFRRDRGYVVVTPYCTRVSIVGAAHTRIQAIAWAAWCYQDRPFTIDAEPVRTRKLRKEHSAMWRKLYRRGYRCVRVELKAA